ncbi:hypothetical protein [Cytobacillus firmus]|uniref:Uncharacterized protein n=1 Tax=Cytobacillus firmus DS1 TaxID=1307436 RepID=W7LBD5_CYTFI|nr:hypothetical protein [Cytobacillus firmus]EWG09339.1 hypothetical protein PBF_19623 [Cytobacillus firmus DS1]
MRVLIFILILLLAALISKGIEKVVDISNKGFINALYFLCVGIISSVTYFLVEKELQLLVSTLVIVGFGLTIFYFFLGFIRKNQEKSKEI